MSDQNLDRICAQFGFQMAGEVNIEFKRPSDTENLITKSLGVLQENGVYAFFLYLASQVKEGKDEKKASKAARALANEGAGLLANNPLALIALDNNSDDYKQAMKKICQPGGLADRLDDLLLAKRLLELALIYARYHAKALEG